jgi:hypothetical protein
VRTFFLHNDSLHGLFDVARVTVGMLPDVALLEKFGFYVDKARKEA